MYAMKQAPNSNRPRLHAKSKALVLILTAIALHATSAHASMFKGEALDTAADVLTWIVLILVPIIGIGVFLLVHILPEKIAEKKRHPQAKAIQVLCLLSLAFGGMLWPLAWLWAYTKPVMYKLAYGTDVAEELEHEKKELKVAEKELKATETEMDLLRAKVAEIEMKLAGQPATDGKKV